MNKERESLEVSPPSTSACNKLVDMMFSTFCNKCLCTLHVHAMPLITTKYLVLLYVSIQERLCRTQLNDFYLLLSPLVLH